MKKKWTIPVIGGVVIILIIGGFFIFRSQSFDEAYKEAKKITSYNIEGSMELLQNDEIKSYEVTVDYSLIDQQDFFKVNLYDKSMNQAQMIVKNQEGVFVLTPSLNQAFKFQSDWPLNSSKPYIYQSMIEFIDESKREKVKDGYLFTGDMQYENDERVKKQELKTDMNLVPLYVCVYDDNDTELIKLTISSFKTNTNQKVEDFNAETLMNTQKKSVPSSVSALYPVAMLGTTLNSEEVSQIDDTTNYILQFTGDKSFTLIEKTQSSSKVSNIETIDGEVIDLVDGFAYYNDHQMTMLSSGVVCSLYSSHLTKVEMLSVLSSMQSSNVK